MINNSTSGDAGLPRCHDTAGSTEGPQIFYIQFLRTRFIRMKNF